MKKTQIRPYAQGTRVPVDNSVAEIKRTIKRYGCEGIMVAEGPAQVQVVFRAHDRMVKFVIHTREADDRELRRLWRCLVLVIKSKLEAVATGIVTFEEEFLGHIVMPDGETIASKIKEDVAVAYETGQTPPLLADLR